ncbi:MAG: DNA primase [Mariniphaga sp.]|nr:DNA primase [Mariniphaga sp.]
MIDQLTIQRILDAADITDVVSGFVTLRRRGVNMLGLCPFHNEKTPSFTVSPSKGIFKCFGCGKGGNVVNFIMEHESLSYPEALKWLARKYSIEVVETEKTEEQKQLKDDRESMMIVSAFAGKYFMRNLWEESEGRAVGLSYFRERGFRDDVLRKFEAGYSPDGKAPFTETAQKQGYRMEYLEKTGLTIRRDDWVRDRFAGRIIFPVHNLAGRIIAFGGRNLKNDPKAAKYLNSPESEIYHKSRELYGIFQARREMARAEKCYLVEGYTDVLSLHQAGIENVVASSGTALTSDQIRLIKRFTNNITIIFDGDEAGIKASLRGIDLVLEEGMNVKVLLLPDGEDPDSFAKKKGAQGFSEYVAENETDFIRFKTSLLMKDAEKDPIVRSRLISDIIRSVSVIPNSITRSVYVKECSRLLNVDEDVLYLEIRKQKYRQNEEFRKRKMQNQREPVAAPTLSTSRFIPDGSHPSELMVEELEFLRFLLRYQNTVIFEKEGENPQDVYEVKVGEYMIEYLENDDLVTENPLFRKIFYQIKENLDDDQFDSEKHFLFNEDSEVSKLATDLLSEKFIESKRWTKAGAFIEKEEEIIDYLVPRIIYEYKLRRVKILLREIEKEIDRAADENNFDLVIEEQSKYMNLKQVEKFLSEKLGSRTIS